MGNDLLSIIREKKQLIANLQAELDEAMRELQGQVSSITTSPVQPKRPIRPTKVKPQRRGIRPESSTAWAQAVLEDVGEPLTMDDILSRIERRFGKKVQKTTLVGNLSRKVKAKDTFTRPAPSTYGLVSFGKEQNLKFG